MEHRKALIAMSGGVDSSVAAYLTQQAGLDCIGATMRLYDNAMIAAEDSTCCSLEDVEDARSVAYKLGMPFHVLNAKAEFEDKVIRPFIHCYECGATPNPCIECNRHLKFHHLLQKAQLLGCDCIVTGHYARIRYDEALGRYLLLKALDPGKDQSYVLYCLTQEQLSHTRFPLGELTKAQARQIAQDHGFLNARKRDSQDICFVPDGDYVAFLERHTGKRYAPGSYLDQTGKVVGTHRGAVAYTLGQRKGLGVALGEPMYVCGKDMDANTVTLGRNADLYSSGLIAENMNWLPFPELTAPLAVTAKIRHSQYEQPAMVYPMENGSVRVVFGTPQRAVTPGQAVVLYDGDMVVGGGTIIKVL